jgi:hypothetical protein
MIFMKFFLSMMAAASLLSTDPGAPKADIEWKGEKTTLELAGKGLRVKKVVFVNVKVYDAYFYASDMGTLQRTEKDFLTSLDTQKRFAMRLKFLRSVDAEAVRNSYRDALKANEVDLEGPGVKEFLQAVELGGEVKEGQNLSMIGVRTATGESLLFENARGEVAEIKGAAGFLKQIMSIWFGETPEAAMLDLKKSLLKAP